MSYPPRCLQASGGITCLADSTHKGTGGGGFPLVLRVESAFIGVNYLTKVTENDGFRLGESHIKM